MRPTGNWRPAFCDRETDFVALALPRPPLVDPEELIVVGVVVWIETLTLEWRRRREWIDTPTLERKRRGGGGNGLETLTRERERGRGFVFGNEMIGSIYREVMRGGV